MTSHDFTNGGENGHVTAAEQAIGAVPSSPPTERNGAGHAGFAAKATCAMPRPVSPDLINDIQEQARRRKFFISLANKQTNSAKALARLVLGWNPNDDEKTRAAIAKRAGRIVDAVFNDKEQHQDDLDVAESIVPDLLVVAGSLLPVVEARNNCELEMKRAVRKLPVYAWAKGVKGLGDLGLAVIIAEAGDLSRYPKKGHLRKRLGLAPVYGKACSTWRREGGLSADEWKDDGPNGPKYAPPRLAQIFACVSDPMSKSQIRAKDKSEGKHGDPLGPYGEVYVRRQFHTDETHPDWTPMHKRMDALRVMTQYLLRDLWREWNRSEAMKIAPETATKALLPSGTNGREAIETVPEKAIGGMPTVHLIAAE